MAAGRVAKLRITQHHQILALISFLILPFGLTQQLDEVYLSEPTPALRLGADELTTVLLVSNENRTASHGRYVNVRPNVGLLTSTARTFIQEGITTEYATQVLGTTLENGRIYAQLLKKSSRVLYDNKESSINPSAAAANGGGVVHTSIIGEDPPRSLLQSHNDLVADKDWQDIDDRIALEKNSFVGNTDFIGSIPKRSYVYPVKASPSSEQSAQATKISFSQSSSSSSGDEKPADKLTPSNGNDDTDKIKANKVQPAIDLPTYTIKNMFLPSGFSWESDLSDSEPQVDAETSSKTQSSSPFAAQRSPKLLYHQVMKDNDYSRVLSTVTYYGFADFTTIVGDSVIVFSPSTSSEKVSSIAQVTSITGKATLGPQEPSYVVKVPITITQDLIEPTFVIPMLSTDVNDLKIMPTDMREKNKEDAPEETETETETLNDRNEIAVEAPVDVDHEEHTTVSPETSDEQTTIFFSKTDDDDNDHEEEDLETEEETTEALEYAKKNVNELEQVVVVSSMVDDVSTSSASESSFIPTPTETTSRVMLSRPSDEEILKIYSSLARAEAEKSAAAQATQLATLESVSTTTEKPVEEEPLEKITTSSPPTKPTTPAPPTPPPTTPTTPKETEEDEAIHVNPPVEGGATTVFFEDDPFLAFIQPSSTEKSTIQQQTKSPTTEQSTTERSEDEEETTTEPSPPSTTNPPEDIEEDTTIAPSQAESPSNVDDDKEPAERIEFKPIIKEIAEDEEVDESCSRTSQVYLTQIPKTVTFYTTFFIPNPDNSDTSTSIETNVIPSFDIAEATKHYCIQSTPVLVVSQSSMSSSVSTLETTEEHATTPMMIVRENAEVTSSSTETYDDEDDDNDDDEETSENDGDLESGEEEIELIYKTLYTTYTYLTTFFHDSTTSISSHKEIVTNIITSSMPVDSSGISSSQDALEIQPTATKPPISSQPATATPDPLRSDLIMIDDILRGDSDQTTKLTEHLDDSKIAKTYFTTYTYYTTIFVDGETEVMSRTEVHTNIVGKSEIDATIISPSARNLQIDDTVSDEDNAVIDISPKPTYDTLQRTSLPSITVNEQQRGGVQELESSSSSSSSRSERKIVPILTGRNLVNGQNQIVDNGVLDDQISSESNTEEIIPSATLLLQTSFTTFTYYTTMYTNDATNVLSRLETITNVVTETLQPTKSVAFEESTLPITYFTTFTYWTKLAKDGEITTLSREETISNVVTPSLALESTQTTTTSGDVSSTTSTSAEQTSVVEQTQAIEPTTFYTTYTYYTTSYVGDETVTDSRFETVTNVVTPSSTVPSSSSVSDAVSENNGLSSSSSSSASAEPSKARTISYDYKTIVDAEGISTLYFTTEVVATEVDGTPTEIASSTSTINIDEVKKALSSAASQQLDGADALASSSTKTYKTGLVRLISGSKLSNQTITVYQSKVIGTIIDERYAQIIESTSSFIIEKTESPALNLGIEASATVNPITVEPTSLVLTLSEKTLESSISDAQTVQKTHEEDADGEGEEHDGEENEGEDESEDENGRPKTRLSFQTRKKTFTPVIRPFVSRNRPQFAPKRKNLLQSSATIITRSDLTPTITATPALKSDARGRFSNSRKSNSGPSSGLSGSSSAGGKRFGRPSKSSQYGPSSVYPGSSSRNRLQSSSYNGGAGGGRFPNSRSSGVNLRGSSTNIRSFSSAYPGNSRLRIRPSSSLPYDQGSSTASYTTLPTDSAEEEGVTQRYDSEEEQEPVVENARRTNNNLLRFRRPPALNRPGFQGNSPVGQRNSPGSSGQVTGRRIPSSQNTRTTTTTTTTTTTQRSRPRVSLTRPSPLGQLQNRSRPQSSLFPPRRLFQQQNQPSEEDLKSGNAEDADNEKEDEESSDYGDDEANAEEEDPDDVNRRRRSEGNSRLSALQSLVKKRSKRQANSFRNRFRRPSTTKPSAEDRADEPTEDESSTTRSRATSRFGPRTHTTAAHSSTSSNKNNNNKSPGNNRAIRPTKPFTSNRAQFTLREKDTTPKHSTPRLSTNFRRPLPSTGTSPSSSSSRRTTTAASTSRAKTSSRLKNYASNPSTESNTRGRTSTNGRSRSSGRGRSRNDFTTDPVVPAFDGTITVTHTTPTEITIPIVNGKVTEYKNVITTTTSTEVVLPNQYTSIVALGSSTLVLNREETSVNPTGATEITQFILHEVPTTTVIFTPTTIRGRKTSFAHMIPSTAYQVENVVSTMQPQIAANAPLANILLSQLLLGNLGSLNQPNINPLLALGGATQANSQIAGSPVTEYKTRTSTYVTTVTNGMATVIPLTFQGKKILTTIYDSSSDVITATEYFTETIVTTPSQQAPQVQQVNSLLLPYLLQQQLQGQGQPQPSPPVLPIQNSLPAQLLFPDNLQDLDHNGIQKYNDYGAEIEDYTNNVQDDLTVDSNSNSNHKTGTHKKSGRKSHKQHAASAAAAAAPAPVESSVITLYVSGRRPGEFSTVLSTVQIQPEPSLHKRQINRAQPLFRSKSSHDDYEDFYASDGSDIEEYLLPASKDMILSHNLNLKSNSLSEETQSLESIVGDVGLWFTKTSALLGSVSGKDNPSTAYDELQTLNSVSSSLSSLSPSSLSAEYFLV